MALTKNKSKPSSKIIAEVVKEVILSVFIGGLITPIKNIVKTRSVAISILIEKKQLFKIYKLKNNKNINKNNFQKKSTNYKSNNNNYQQKTHKEPHIP